MLAFSVACLPLYAVRWQYGPLPTTLLENLILATIALYLVARWREGRLRFHRTPLDIPIVILLLSGAISVLVARDHRGALGLYRAYFIEPIALYYVATDLLQLEKHFRFVLIGFGIGSSAFAVLNIANFIAAWATNTIALGSPPSAIYGSSNEVAMYLEPPLAFASALVFTSARRSDRMLGLAWAAFLVPALLLTLSRGAFLALAVYSVVVIATLSRSARKPLLIAIGAAAAVFVATLLLGSNTPLVIHRLSLKALEYTSVTRFEIYGATLQMLVHHPIFGLGLGGYLYVFHGFPEIYPHDLWLAFWVELGFVGLAAFAYIFLWLLRNGWQRFLTATGLERLLLWGAVGALVLWGVHGLFDTPYWKNDMSVEFWLVASIQLAAARTRAGGHDLTATG